jgi:hypothetical protein
MLQCTPQKHRQDNRESSFATTAGWRQAAIKKNPKSAFWHNQAGVAYNALGEFKSAAKEI